MTTPGHVYLLWHGDDVQDEAPEPKLLGVYSSKQLARDRIDQVVRDRVPGFSDHPDNFVIDRYEINKDEWVEGYVEIDPVKWIQEGDGTG